VRKNDNLFYGMPGQTERKAGKVKDTPGPSQYLATGQVSRLGALQLDGGSYVLPTPSYLKIEKAVAIYSGAAAVFARTVQRLCQAMASKVRTQDVRSAAKSAWTEARKGRSSTGP
jgi:hypothetical protein